MRLTFSIIAIFLLKISCAFAQPNDLGYEPPAGWMYVRSLDQSAGLHASGDTVVLSFTVPTGSTTGNTTRILLLASSNGGAFWDTLKLPDNLEIEYSQYRKGHFIEYYSFLPNTASLCAVEGNTEDSTKYFVITRDLGKTYERYQIDPYFATPLVDFKTIGIYFNPHDEKDIFLHFLLYYGVTASEAVLRSRDGGRTWTYQQLPMPSYGLGNTHRIVFDVRQKGLWYVSTQATYHYIDEEYYRTEDNGETFEPIKNFGQYAGISEVGSLRSIWLWENNTSMIGMKDFSPSGTDTIKHNWMKKFYGKYIPEWEKGYGNGLDKTTYHFLKNNPHRAIISAGEGKKDTATNLYIHRRFDIFQTENDGEIWTSIWKSLVVPTVTALDQRIGEVWAIGVYGDPNDPVDIKQWALWRKRIFTSISEYPETSGVISSTVRLSPHPATDFTDIRYTTSTSGRIIVQLYDLQGKNIRTLYSGWQEAGNQRILWNMSAEIPSGTYFLKLESGSTSISQKLVITR